MTQRIDAAPDTVHWGFFDATLPPLLTIDSGERVTLSTVSGAEQLMPPPPLVIPPALTAIHQEVTRRVTPGHICTGPVAVRGARPGQTLQIDIERIELHYDWGYNVIRPLEGALPHDFGEPRLIHIPLDRHKMTGRLPSGIEIPLRPFLWCSGCHAAAQLGQDRHAATAQERR